MTRGLCTNLPSVCSKAAAKEPVEMTGPDGRCSECGSALRAVTGGDSQRRTIVVAGAGALGVALLAGIGYALYQRRPGSNETATPGTQPPGDPHVADAPEVLRLHGSNTVGAALAPALVEAFLKREGYGELKRTAGAKPEESQMRGRRADGRSVVVEIFAHGTSTAFTGLAEGKADIGMASRKMNDEEAAATKPLGDLRAAANEYVLALDGVAIIVNGANPLRQLRIDQVRALFSGRAKDWADVGGNPGEVKLYVRNDKSGTTDTFKALVMGKEKMSPETQPFEDSNELSGKVSADPGAIGFVGMPYVKTAKALAISDGDTTAFRPTRTTVATEDYALSRRLYLYLPTRASVLARKFVDFAAISDAGQAIAEQIGFVGQYVPAEGSSGQAQKEFRPEGDLLPAEYKQLTRNAERLELSMRFRFGSAELDGLALQNVRRIARIIEKSGGSKSVLVFGFGDNRGSASATMQVSQDRADAVAAELRSFGPVARVVKGFGSAVPLAPNDSDAGRERNRRAEVWINAASR